MIEEHTCGVLGSRKGAKGKAKTAKEFLRNKRIPIYSLDAILSYLNLLCGLCHSLEATIELRQMELRIKTL